MALCGAVVTWPPASLLPGTLGMAAVTPTHVDSPCILPPTQAGSQTSHQQLRCKHARPTQAHRRSLKQTSPLHLHSQWGAQHRAGYRSEATVVMSFIIGAWTFLAVFTQKLISHGAWTNDTWTAAKLLQAIIKERV